MPNLLARKQPPPPEVAVKPEGYIEMQGTINLFLDMGSRKKIYKLFRVCTYQFHPNDKKTNN